MNILNVGFVKNFITFASDATLLRYHERNGGNLSYRIINEEFEEIQPYLSNAGEWKPIGASVPLLAGECFMVTGSGKYFRNIERDPEASCCIIRLDEKGDNYRIEWGLSKGGRPTSELPTHLMNHETKVRAGIENRVIYHCHPLNLIALTSVLPLTDEAFTKELWQTMTECPVIFPEGIGVVPWMVPGGFDIAVATAKKMETYQAVVWAQHGLFCCGPDFDLAFGLAETIEKSAEICVKTLSTGLKRINTITRSDLQDLARDFNLVLPEKHLNYIEKDELSYPGKER